MNSGRFDGFTLDELRELMAQADTQREISEREAVEVEMRMNPLKDQRSKALNRAHLCRNEVSALSREIEKRTAPKPEPTVTDHALLRYIERVCEIDVESLRRQILTPTVKQAIQSGATAVKTAEFLAVVKGHAITTITTPEIHPERKNNKLTRAQRERLEEDNDPCEKAIRSGSGAWF